MTETLGTTTAIATGPDLVGAWVYDPADPDGTLRQFPFATGRSEVYEVDEVEIPLVGRLDSLIEYGTSELVEIPLSVFVPFGADHDAQVDWWRQAKRARGTLVYRDGRGRVQYSAIKGRLAISDDRAGTTIALTLRRIGYDLEAAS